MMINFIKLKIKNYIKKEILNLFKSLKNPVIKKGGNSRILKKKVHSKNYQKIIHQIKNN